ncbi:4Fe-4S dicluster domain-containing protein [Marinobacter sp. Arc7-DN-1]|uniref:4Fe-4S dicluster domain-containing protein n=1 Tax=Marinobacter sp. Arc7-DN-1 TaxID=2304594 RepID=UPI000E44810A|nr:4Fe-4S binding protein [Marinobacter sp. Arc7-DN-1]AXS84107.1 4Fe-4S dicluster domain-containing protein [Marinobacter sp. Arc7-DN-1]
MPLPMVDDLPELRNSRCVRYRFRYSQCSDCADNCPSEALTLGEEGVELDATRCSSCGLCVAACPVGAFRQPTFPTAALAKPAEKRLSVACKPSGEKGDLLIPCLGDIEPALLASLSLRKIAVTLRGAGHCAECAYAPQGAEVLRILLEGMQALAESASTQSTLPVLSESVGGSGYRADRRQFFRRFSNRAVENFRAEDSLEVVPQQAIRAAPHFVPARRKLAETVLEQLGGIDAASPLPALFGVAVVTPIAGRCTGCEACARVCPTGALKIDETENRWVLRFDAARCVGCGVCIEACGAQALQIEPRWYPGPVEPDSPLHELGRCRCESCGRFFIGLEGEGCPVCRDDEENFGAIFG